MRTLRALPVACALVAASVGCSGDGPTPPPPSTRLTLSCGTYNHGVTGATLVVAAILEPATPGDVVLRVNAMGMRSTMRCRGGERVCIAALNDLPPVPVTVEGDLGTGRDSVATCTPDVSRLLAQPAGTAEVAPGRIDVTWEPVPDAAVYAVRLRDLDLGHDGPAEPRMLGTLAAGPETHASFVVDGAAPDVGVVEVEAWRADPGLLSGDPATWPVGFADRSVAVIPVVGAPWSMTTPAGLAAGATDLPVPPGSRMAVILLNVGGPDRAHATVRATGTGRATARATGPSSLASNSPRPGLRPASAIAVSSSVVARTPGASPGRRTFCTFLDATSDLNSSPAGGSPHNVVGLRPATLLLETADALLYVDDDDVAGFASSDLDALAQRWHAVAASVTSHSGPPTDVDGNRKFILFFTRALGPRVWSVANYYDVVFSFTGSPRCSEALAWYRTNVADMIHLHPPFDMEDPGGDPLTREEAWAAVTGRMAYSLQRMVDAGRFDWEYPVDLTLHLRMSLAETLAGSGFHRPGLRALAAPLVFTRAGYGPRSSGYPSLALYPDERSPVNRVADDALILYLVDRLGPDFVERFLSKTNTLAQLDAATGIPFPIAYALWTGALVFSNEPASPWSGFDYLGEDWTPLHEKFQRFEYAPLEAGDPVAVTLRTNGFDVYVTGVAGPDGGTVTVTSDETVKPYVVAIPFRGSLP